MFKKLIVGFVIGAFVLLGVPLGYAQEGGGASPRWKAPRNTFVEMEASTSDASVRMTLDTHSLWAYNAAASAWSLVSGGSAFNWLTPIIREHNPAVLPVGPVAGDRYLSLGTANGWTINHIYTWSGAAWTNTTPVVNDAVYNTTTGSIKIWDGATWRLITAGTSFLSLSDSPHTYVAQAFKFPKVNTGETALSYSTMTEDASGNVIAGNSIQTGKDGTDGSLKIYSEQGATDYTITLNPNAAMTESTIYTLPIAKALANGQMLASTTAGVMSWTSPTLQYISDFGAITTNQLSLQNSTAIDLGKNETGGTPNIAGLIKLWSAGDNAYYNTITAGTNTANAAYTLPTAMAAANNYALVSTTAGVMSWVHGGGIAAPGSNQEVIFNNAGVFGADPGFTYASASDSLTLGEGGQNGSISLYSEVGVTDYTVKLQPSATMTQDTTYTLPTAKATANNQMLMSSTAGLMAWSALVEDASGNIAIGKDIAGTQYTLTVDGRTTGGVDNNGVVAWLPDTDQFTMNCSLGVNTGGTYKGYLGDDTNTRGGFFTDGTRTATMANGSSAASLVGNLTFDNATTRQINMAPKTGVTANGNSLTVVAGTGFGTGIPSSGGQISIQGGESGDAWPGAVLNISGGRVADAYMAAGRSGITTIRGADNAAMAGNNAGGPIYLIPGAPSGSGAGGSLYIQSLAAGSSVYAILDSHLLATGVDRTFAFPDQSGTFALTSDIPVPAGNDHNVQFNNSGAFGGSDNLSYNDTTDVFQIGSVATGEGIKTGELRLANGILPHYVGFKASNATGTDTTYTLPIGSSGDIYAEANIAGVGAENLTLNATAHTPLVDRTVTVKGLTIRDINTGVHTVVNFVDDGTLTLKSVVAATGLPYAGASGTYVLITGVITLDAGAIGSIENDTTSTVDYRYTVTGLLKSTEAGVMSWDLSTYLTAEADTLSTVTGRGATTATSSLFQNALAVELGKDVAGGTPNIPGAMKLWSGSDDAYAITVNSPSSGFSESWTMTLPAVHGSASQFLQTDGTGVTTWATALTAEADTLSTVTTRGATTAVSSSFENATALVMGKDVAGGTPNIAGSFKMFGAGDNAWYTTFTTGSQSQNIDYVLPLNDGDANQFLQTNGTGTLVWATAISPEADTLASVTGRGATTTVSSSFQNALALVLGEDIAGGTPNTAGSVKLWSAGDNAWYTTITAATQNQNVAYILPVDDGAPSDFLQTNGTGTLSWTAYSDADTLASVTTRGSSTTNAISVGNFQTGYDGADGNIRIFSEQGAPDYTVDIAPSAAMTGSYSLYLPTAAPAGTYFLKVATTGIMSYDASTYLTAEADTLASVTGRGALTTTAVQFQNALAIELGQDVAGGTPNVVGALKLWSAGDNAYYTTITDSTQTQAAIAYTLPVDDGNSNQFLQTNGSGVLTWATALTAEADTLGAVTGRGASTAVLSTFTGGLTLGADDDPSNVIMHSASTIQMYDDSDDTSITIGPVENGTTVLGVTGDVAVGSANIMYFGVSTTDGTWCIVRDGNNLVFKRREGGSYNIKFTMVP